MRLFNVAAIPFILGLIGSGCTTIRTVRASDTRRELAKLEPELEGENVELRLSPGVGPQDSIANQSGVPTEGTHVGLDGARLAWLDEHALPQSAPLALVRSLRYLPEAAHVRGLLEGVGIGVLPGLVAGLLSAVSCNLPAAGNGSAATCGFGPAALGIGLGFLGLVVGGVIGVAAGHQEEVVFAQGEGP